MLSIRVFQAAVVAGMFAACAAQAAHPIDDRVQVAGLVDRRTPQLLDGGENGAALRVPEHDDEARAVVAIVPSSNVTRYM